MKDFIKVAKALSDPGRVKIIKILQRRIMCVCEIHTALDLAQSTVSKHLKILEEAGLVTSCKDGLWVNYQLAGNDASPYAHALLGHLHGWLEEESEVRELVKKLPEIRREMICGG